MSWVNRKRELKKKMMEEAEEDPILMLSGGKINSSHTTFNSYNEESNTAVPMMKNDRSSEAPKSTLHSSSQSLSEKPSSNDKIIHNKSNSNIDSLDSFLNNVSSVSNKNPNHSMTSNSMFDNKPPQSGQPNLPQTKQLPNVPQSKTGSQHSTTTVKPLPKVSNPPSSVTSKVTNETTEQNVKKSDPVQSPSQKQEMTLEMFESLKKQIIELELENQKLKRELQESQGGSLHDMVEEIPSNQSTHDSGFDDYFSDKKVIVLTLSDEIREGLRCNELNKVHIVKTKTTSKKKPPVYGTEEEDEESEIINQSSKTEDGYEYKYSKTNYYVEQNKELDAWCNLRRLRDSKHKISLLKSCGKNYDIVLPILLSIEQSLNFRSFMDVLVESDRQEGYYVWLYIKFLKKLGDTSTLLKVYKFHGMIREQALLQYQLAIQKHDPYERIEDLEHCLSFIQKNAQVIDNPTGFLSHKYSLDCAEELSIAVANLIHLITKQIKIDEQDNIIAKSGKNSLFIQFKKYPIYNTTLSETLKYCLFYHNAVSDDQVTSPKSLAKFFNLSQHRFLYEAVVARSRIGDWKGVMNIFGKAKKDGLCYCSAFDLKIHKENSSFMKLISGKPNRSESNSILNIHNILQVLKIFKAPRPMIRDLLESYAFQKTEIELKFEIAKEYRIYDVAIRCIVDDLKDRDLLVKLKEDLNKRYHDADKSALQDEINSHLYNKKIKWKKATINV
ncbi:hypothetical protein C9374_001022 [Naegleria lovaniensis]|uniref:Uncharacterized protein n=1 Tax=Naegleria lovaniensis TaxID=51637 RepID=A0AA88GW81_NAELO|nr:uncharacterized protein C9374_001022 [Naegleria lovaniensis]KAG2388172.1 hypothetical protein C9374_001022 [Naegleria lovaniensis]